MGPGVVAVLGQGGKGQDALAQAVEFEFDGVPIQARRHPEEPVGIVGEPVEIAQVGPFHVRGDGKVSGVFEAQHGVPPAQIVGDGPTARGQVVALRVEPAQQVLASQFH